MSYLLEQALRGLTVARMAARSGLRAARDWSEMAVRTSFNWLIWLVGRGI